MYRIFTLTTALSIIANLSFAQTNVSGQIRSNTNWTKAGSPYICSGLIEVDTNVTLTIEPGAIVELDQNLIVYGELIFQHNGNDTTIIKSNNTGMPFVQFKNPDYTDSIVIKHYKFSGAGLTVYWPKSNVVISECLFTQSSITWRPTGSPVFVFENNVCNQADLHMSTYTPAPGHTSNADRVIINENIFYQSQFMAINGEIVNNNPVEITNNIFKNGGTGIRLAASGGLLIKENVFAKNDKGLLLWPIWKLVRITSNVFVENDVAIQLNDIGDTLEIIDNTIYGNNAGIAIYYEYKSNNNMPLAHINSPVIAGNCIYDNTNIGIGWGATNNISLGANWWGTTDTNIIDGAIFDNKDDFKMGKISYQPFLTQANSQCKAYIPPAKTEEILIEKNLVTVYPNPVTNTLSLKSDNPIKDVSLYNLVGKLVYHAQANDNMLVINTQEYPVGVYLYKITTGDGVVQTGKVIKQ